VRTKQAEAITSAITEVLNDSLESISKAEMQKVFTSGVFVQFALGFCTCTVLPFNQTPVGPISSENFEGVVLYKYAFTKDMLIALCQNNCCQAHISTSSTGCQ